jgi:hypothetical protein
MISANSKLNGEENKTQETRKWKMENGKWEQETMNTEQH